MSDISDDIRATASRVYWENVHDHEENIERIASALASERERAAKIAYEMMSELSDEEYGAAVAHAIRTPTEGR